MDRDAAVSIIKQRMGNNEDSSLDSLIVTEMVLVQETILEGDPDVTPWFLLSETSRVSCTADDYRLRLPSDFLKEWEEGALYVCVTEQGVTKTYPLAKGIWDEIKEEYDEDGRPKKYSIGGDYFFLSPTPDQDYLMNMRYYQKDDSLASSNIENKWLKYAADWLIAETGFVIAGQYQQMPAMAQVFQQQAAVAKRRVLKRDISVRMANFDGWMGEA